MRYFQVWSETLSQQQCSRPLWLANVISHYYLLNFRSKLWLASGYCDFSLLFAQFSFKALIGYCDFSLLFAQFSFKALIGYCDFSLLFAVTLKFFMIWKLKSQILEVWSWINIILLGIHSDIMFHWNDLGSKHPIDQVTFKNFKSNFFIFDITKVAW